MSLGNFKYGPGKTGYIQTTDATQVEVARLSIPLNHAALIKVDIIAQHSADYWYRTSLHATKNATGIAVYFGQLSIIDGSSGAGTWVVTVDCDSDALRVRVTGQGSHTINWTCVLSFELCSEIAQFLPIDLLPAPITWVRSDMGVTAAGPDLVSAWNDHSAGGHNYLQGTAANKPQLVPNAYGSISAIRGNADAKRALAASAYSFSAGAGTIIMIFSKSSLAASYITDHGSGRGIIEAFGAGSVEWYNPPDEFDLSHLAPSSGLHYTCISQIDSVRIDGYFDSTYVSMLTPGFAINPPRYLGGYGGYTNCSDGDIVEVIVFGRVLVNSEYLALYNYLSTRYGLTFNYSTVFKNAIGCIVSGNNLTKAIADGWTSGASTVNTISSNGYVTWSVDSLGQTMAGLSNGDSSVAYADIDFAIYTTAGGQLYIIESGGLFYDTGYTYIAGDILKVQVTGTIITYYKGDTLLYTSLVAATFPLCFDSSLYSHGQVIQSVNLVG